MRKILPPETTLHQRLKPGPAEGWAYLYQPGGSPLGGYGNPAGPLRDNSIAYLEYCHNLGAIGVQMTVKGNMAEFRRRAEDLNMFVEYQSSLPRPG